MLLFANDAHFLPSGNHLAAILIYNFILENDIFAETMSSSKIDWLSPEISNLVQQSNQSMQNEIDASRYPLYLKGWKDIQNKRYGEAESNLEKYLEVGRNLQATFLLCYAYFANKKYMEAKDCFYSLPKGLDIAHLKFRYLAEIHLENNEPENALKILDELKKLQPIGTKGSSKFNYLLGKAYWQINKMNYAELYFKIAARRDPKDYLNIFTLGSFYYAQGKYEKSISEFQRANSLKPEESKYFLFLSIANFRLGNIEEGNRLIKEFIWKCKSSCEEILGKDDWLLS
jgi:tetratricopeptide (TPR) repeat protein